MSDIVKLFGGLLDGLAQPYDDRKLGRDVVGDFIVSTVLSTDMGFETAILDAVGTYAVERYATKEEALAGHKRWVSEVASLTHVTELGYGELIDSKVKKLVPLSHEQKEDAK